MHPGTRFGNACRTAFHDIKTEKKRNAGLQDVGSNFDDGDMHLWRTFLLLLSATDQPMPVEPWKVLQKRLERAVAQKESLYSVIPIRLAKSLLVQEEQQEDTIRLLPTTTTALPCFQKPAVKTLCQVLHQWYMTGELPQRDETFGIPGVQEIDAAPSLCSEASSFQVLKAYQQLLSESDMDNEDSSDKVVDHLLAALGKPGILHLLGHRYTIGSIDALCPPLSLLCQSFQQPHTVATAKNTSRLTVGARALTKHAVRGGDFWPTPTGNDAAKNQWHSISWTRLYKTQCGSIVMSYRLVVTENRSWRLSRFDSIKAMGHDGMSMALSFVAF